ncbi:hypothetical protein CHISP_3051 [Chitinispirillum alkaliphilum]|nr:hypothetical protein CHISP_3051 [Chitinispirillum alkaliphilum]
MKRLFFSLFTLVVLFGAITATQSRLTSVVGTAPKPQSMAYLPSSERVKPLMIGYHETFSHYLWIRTVIYFGSQMMSERELPWLIQMLDIITRLHPHFFPAYEFAGLLVPDLCGDPDAARVIMERGMIHLGETRWNIPFILGMLYYRYYDDYEMAARYFSLASRIPGPHSQRLATLSATFFHRSGRGTEGLELLLLLYETSDNPEVRRHLGEKIEELVEELKG